ncbi:MAG: hypothetical protein KAS88_04815 [Deltaproteobacteria bacterium]|nr:hypothetical protein [Deltaproteobacteria bacterium]
MDEEIASRLERIFSAIGETVNIDFTDIKQKSTKTNSGSTHIIDFNGGYTDEQLSNLAHMAISNVASLTDHIIRWVRRNNKDKKIFDELFAGSLNIMAIKDLDNNDKHGYPPRNKGLTKKSIKLMKVKRSLKISSTPPGVASPTTHKNSPIKIVQGDAKLVITAPIVDEDDNTFGELHNCLMSAISEYEQIILAYS